MDTGKYSIVIRNEGQDFYREDGFASKREATDRGLKLVQALHAVPWKADISASIENEHGDEVEYIS